MRPPPPRWEGGIWPGAYPGFFIAGSVQEWAGRSVKFTGESKKIRDAYLPAPPPWTAEVRVWWSNGEINIGRRMAKARADGLAKQGAAIGDERLILGRWGRCVARGSTVGPRLLGPGGSTASPQSIRSRSSLQSLSHSCPASNLYLCLYLCLPLSLHSANSIFSRPVLVISAHLPGVRACCRGCK